MEQIVSRRMTLGMVWVAAFVLLVGLCVTRAGGDKEPAWVEQMKPTEPTSYDDSAPGVVRMTRQTCEFLAQTMVEPKGSTWCKSIADCAVSALAYCTSKGTVVEFAMYAVQSKDVTATCAVTCVDYPKQGKITCTDYPKQGKS